MKRKNDPRHQKRTRLMQELFEWDFKQDKPSSSIDKIVNNLKSIDELISQSAPERPVNNINKIDLAILRLCVFELIMEKDAPFKVVVDEAVELGKEYGSNSSASFINGVLGKIIENNNLDKE